LNLPRVDLKPKTLSLSAELPTLDLKNRIFGILRESTT